MMIQKRVFFLLALLVLGLVTVSRVQAVPAGDFNQSTEYHIQVVRAYFETRDQVQGLVSWTSPWEVNYEKGYVVLGIRTSDYQKLFDAGFSIEFDQEMTLWANRPNIPLPNQGGGIPGYPCYRTVEETFATGQTIANTYPQLAEWIDAGDSWEKSVGQGGYDMMVLRLTNETIAGPKPVLYVTSAIHAREYTTAELATRFAEYLVQNYGIDADVTWILDSHEIHLMLHTNPDGRKEAETGQLWRKNTNNNYCANSNSRGADLNRNFEFQWGCCGGSSGSQCSETYRGASAASEPEVQAVQNYALSVLLDQRDDPINDPAPVDATGLYLDLHSYSELVLWPWGFTGTDAPNGTALQTLGRKFAYYNDYMPQQAIELYVTDGTTDDYFYGEFGVAAYTFELGTSFFQQCSVFESTILPDNLPALVYAAKSARTPYMTGGGPDSLNVTATPGLITPGTSVVLTAQVNDTRYSNNNGTEPTQTIAAAQYYIDTPPWAGGTPVAMSASDGSFNSGVENVTATINTTGLSGGRHTIYVRGRDAGNNWGVVTAVFLTVLGGNEGSVDGILTDALTGEPVAGTVREPNLNISTNSDPVTGEYSLSLPAGTWTIEASANYHISESVNGVSVTDGNVTPLNFALDPTAGIGLPADVSSNQFLGQTRQKALRIQNLGNAPLTWELQEIDGAAPVASTQAISVLLVDDDDNTPNVRPYYEAALTTLGVSYQLFDVGGGAGNGPTAAEMANYDVVIWFSGDQYGSLLDEAGPNATDEVQLASYLNNGGKLFLSAQDYYYDRGLTSFMTDNLGVGSMSDDNGDYTNVTGQNEFAGMGPYTLSYPGTDYSDPITPNASGTVAFLGNNSRNGAVYAQNSVFFAFMWEGIQNGNAGNGQAVMDAILLYLAPSEIPWLTTNATSGTIPGGAYTDLILNFNANPPVTANGLYTGTLRFQSNDPATPFAEVNIAMTVADAQLVSTLTYQYSMNDGSNGSGTYQLYNNGSFIDGSYTGGWSFQQSPARVYLQHDPGYACRALSIGGFPGGAQIQGIRLCRDGSGLSGVWSATVTTGHLQPQ